MPPKKKVPEGEMTGAELRKLIRAHNKLTKITIPKGTDREGIIKIIESNGYKVNHPKKRLDAQVKRGKQISLKKADEILPKPKTKEQKAAEKQARDMKKKESTDKIKAEGVKQGAAIQRIIERKKREKAVPKVEPKKKEEPVKNERYKITEKFMKDNDIFSQKFLKLYKESGEQTPEFKKLYKQKQRLIAKYKSENGGQSITTELKKLRTPWLQAWIESDEAYEKFLKKHKKYPLISNSDNFLDYLKSRLV